MVFILNAKKDFEGAHLGPCEAHWGPIKMAHDQARSQPDIFGGARAIFGGANIFSFTYAIMRFVI